MTKRDFSPLDTSELMEGVQKKAYKQIKQLTLKTKSNLEILYYSSSELEQLLLTRNHIAKIIPQKTTAADNDNNAVGAAAAATEKKCDGKRAKFSCCSDIVRALANKTDVIPGKYEGGFTLWPGAFKLVHFLDNKNAPNLFSGKTVLELGCGAGLPGIYALKRGAKKVYFQDFNQDVLRYWTLPNVKLNSNSSKNSAVGNDLQSFEERCEFLDCDWRKLARNRVLLASIDCIITSETIYSPDTYTVLSKLFKRFLFSRSSSLNAGEVTENEDSQPSKSKRRKKHTEEQSNDSFNGSAQKQQKRQIFLECKASYLASGGNLNVFLTELDKYRMLPSVNDVTNETGQSTTQNFSFQYEINRVSEDGNVRFVIEIH